MSVGMRNKSNSRRSIKMQKLQIVFTKVLLLMDLACAKCRLDMGTI